MNTNLKTFIKTGVKYSPEEPLQKKQLPLLFCIIHVLHSVKTFYVYSVSKIVDVFPILTLRLLKRELQAVRQIVWILNTLRM